MRHIVSLFCGAALVLSLAPAHAGDGKSKVSFGYTHYDSEGGELGMVTGRYSYFPVDYLGLEAELSTGVVDEDIMVGDQTATVSVDLAYGLYTMARLPIDQRGSNVFVRAGVHQVELGAESGATTAETDLEGFAYGGGLNVMFSNHHGVRLDYTRLEGENDESADTYSLSYVLRF